MTMNEIQCLICRIQFPVIEVENESLFVVHIVIQYRDRLGMLNYNFENPRAYSMAIGKIFVYSPANTLFVSTRKYHTSNGKITENKHFSMESRIDNL